MKTLTFSAVALAAVAVAPASALEVSKSVDVAAPPAKVWQTIRDFCGIGNWHPAVEKCEPSTKEGKAVRTLSLKGGGTIVEEQLARDDKKMDYSYTILQSPLPVSDYKSTIMVMPSGSGSKVQWQGTFKAKGADDAKAKEVITGIYDAGLSAIASKAK
ncbi:SRPBCC family protein [Methylobacterium oxalidis]|uniref:Polyketide cyclase n=1 Tax=Methylobacterium oxalidis TaxID=944322 RepID=A0A512JAG2_9HYPH|nr:SRPBCC family protein [Methylobacterium oxalidis]GEP06943.1 polyketide cyclase [Methylobacterium oxalidis]GJE34166.1 IS1595 family transposase ISMpo2 [Methylobacterium oxalidis]GLS64551.1 polyketide cyclase [Methylobacterium oxalidis]